MCEVSGNAASVAENNERKTALSIGRKAEELGLTGLRAYVSDVDYIASVSTLYKYESFGKDSAARRRMVACAAAILKYITDIGLEYTVKAFIQGNSASLRAEVQFAPGNAGIVDIILVVPDGLTSIVPAVNFRASGLEYKFQPKRIGKGIDVPGICGLITPRMSVDLVKKAFGQKVERYGADGSGSGFVGEVIPDDENAFPDNVRMSDVLTAMIPEGKSGKGKRYVWTSCYSAVPVGDQGSYFRISVSDFGRSDKRKKAFNTATEADEYIRDAYEKARCNIRNEIGLDDIISLAETAASDAGREDEAFRPQRDTNSRIADIQKLCYKVFLGLYKAAAEEGLYFGSDEVARRTEACRSRVSESVDYYLGNIGEEDRKYVILSYDSDNGQENGSGTVERSLPARSVNASAISLFMDFGIAEPTVRENIISALKTLKRENDNEHRPYSVIPDCLLSERDLHSFGLYTGDGTGNADDLSDGLSDDETEEDLDTEPKSATGDGSGDKYSYFSRKLLRSYIVFDESSKRDITPGSPGYDSLPPFLRRLGCEVYETLVGLGIYGRISDSGRDRVKRSSHTGAEWKETVVEIDRHGIIHYAGTAHSGIEAVNSKGKPNKSYGMMPVEGYLGQVFEPVTDDEAGYRVITDAYGDRIAVPSLSTGLIKENYSYGENRYIIPGSSASIVRPSDENDKRSFVNRTVVQGYEERIINAVRFRLTNAVIKNMPVKGVPVIYYGETDLNNVYNQVLVSGKLPADFEDETGKQDFELERMYENYDATRACILAGRGRLLYDREFMNNTSIISEKRSEQRLKEMSLSGNGMLSDDGGDEEENGASSELEGAEHDSDDSDVAAMENEEEKNKDDEGSDSSSESGTEAFAASDTGSGEVYALSRIRGERKDEEDHIYAPTRDASIAVVPAGIGGIAEYNALVAGGEDPWKDDDGYVWKVELFDSRATGSAKQQGAVRYFAPLFTVKDDIGLLHTDLEKCRRTAALTCEVLGSFDSDSFGGKSLGEILAGGTPGEKSEAVNALIAEKLAEYKKPLIVDEEGVPGCPADEVNERYLQYYRMRRISFSDSELEGVKDTDALERSLRDKARDAVAREAGECAVLGLPEMYGINEYNPANRINMSLSHKKCCLHTAYGRRGFVLNDGRKIELKHSIGVGTAYMSVGGWTQDDAFVISREFSYENRVKAPDGNYRPLGIGDKLCDDSGNKGVVSIVVDRSADPDGAYFTDPAHEPMKRLVMLFRDNPTLDIVGAPYAMTARNNGGTARAMMRSIKAARRAENELGLETGSLTVLKVNDRILPDGIGYITWTVTDKTVDAKSRIYDPHKDEGRSISHQLVWALDGLGASLFKEEVFRTNGREFSKAREIMRVLGAGLNEINEIIPVTDISATAGAAGKAEGSPADSYEENSVFDVAAVIGKHTRNVRRKSDGTLVFETLATGKKNVAPVCDDCVPDEEYIEAGVLESGNAIMNMGSVYPEKNAAILTKFYSYVLNLDCKYIKLPFEIKWGRGELTDTVPLFSKRFRSVYESVEGKQITHEYTNFYLKILENSGKYIAHRRSMELALDVCTTAYISACGKTLTDDERAAEFVSAREKLEKLFMLPAEAYRSEHNVGKDGRNVKMYELLKSLDENGTAGEKLSECIYYNENTKRLRKYADMLLFTYIGIVTGELTEKELGKKYGIKDTGEIVLPGEGEDQCSGDTDRSGLIAKVSDGLKNIGYTYKNQSLFTLTQWIREYHDRSRKAEECRREAGKYALIMYYKLFNDNIASKNNIFKQCFERTRTGGGATAVISPNPTLRLDRVLLPRDFAEKIGLVSPETSFETLKQECKDNRYSVLIWRDPVLSNGAVRYPYADIIETREGHEGYDPDDPMNTLKTIALNPSSVKSQEGDFDGDTVGVYVPRSEAAARSLDAHCRHHLNALNTETVAEGKFRVQRESFDTVTVSERTNDEGRTTKRYKVTRGKFTYTISENPYDAYYTRTLDVASGLDTSGAESAASPSHDKTAAELRRTCDELVERMNDLYLELDAVCAGKKEYFSYSVRSCSDDDEEEITEGEHKECKRSAEEVRADMKETFDRFSGCILEAQKNSFGCDALCFTDAKALFASVLPQTLSGAKGSPEKLVTPAMWFGAEYDHKTGELTDEDIKAGYSVVCRSGGKAHAIRVAGSADGHTLAEDADRLAAFLATSMKDWDTGIVGKPAQFAVTVTRNYDSEYLYGRVNAEPGADPVRDMPEILDSLYGTGKSVAAAMAITHPITQSVMGLKKLSKDQILPKQRLYDELTPALLNGNKMLLKVVEDGAAKWIKSPKTDRMTPKCWRDMIVGFFSDSDGLNIGVPGFDVLREYSGCLTVKDPEKKTEYICGLRVRSHKEEDTTRKEICVPGDVSILDILCYLPLKGNVFRSLVDPENASVYMSRGNETVPLDNSLFGKAVTSLLLPAKRRMMLEKALSGEDKTEKGENTGPEK
ncbi:MAG: hypothetical protein IK093_09325 [Ruminiclostridium sp.]|nr:hypothetical protein [Ruminiclostridium sp.]